MEKYEDNISFEEFISQSLKDIKEGKTVTGKIINISSNGEIFVDIGYKADGIISKDEYSYDENANPLDEFKQGDRITAEVLKLNDGLGNVVLSYKRSKLKLAKKEFESKVNHKCIFKEKVTEVNENGFIVNYKGIRIFIPLYTFPSSTLSQNSFNLASFSSSTTSLIEPIIFLFFSLYSITLNLTSLFK